jgi:hypothetical protein
LLQVIFSCEFLTILQAVLSRQGACLFAPTSSPSILDCLHPKGLLRNEGNLPFSAGRQVPRFRRFKSGSFSLSSSTSRPFAKPFVTGCSRRESSRVTPLTPHETHAPDIISLTTNTVTKEGCDLHRAYETMSPCHRVPCLPSVPATRDLMARCLSERLYYRVVEFISLPANHVSVQATVSRLTSTAFF